MAKLTQSEVDKLTKALERHYKTDVMYGKGGFFIRGKGSVATKHISLAKARQITGIKGKKKAPSKVHGGYGDYAIMRKIAGRM